MRRILVDHARGRLAAKRGAGVVPIEWIPGLAASREGDTNPATLIDLDRALDRLAAQRPRPGSGAAFDGVHPLGAADLAIGIPQESVQDPETGEVWLFAGGVTIVPGGFGLDAPSAEFWAQGFRGSAGAADLADNQAYGSTLAAGDFDGNGHDDLAIGALYVDGLTSPGFPSVASGAVYVLYGALFADGFESADTAVWTTSVP